MVDVTDTGTLGGRAGAATRLSRLLRAMPGPTSAPAIALAAGAVALLIGITQLTAPGWFRGVLGYNLGYDDGVYFGAPTRLVHGAIPYRDFTIVYPPGHVSLMLPIALLGRLIGTAAGLEIARVLTVLVVAANATLGGLLVRSAGRVATAVAGLAMALWPLTVSVDRTSELEPYLVLFCLLGSLVLFERGGLSSGRRLLAGTALLGVACTVKVWAVLPVIAVILVCLWRCRRDVGRVLVGILAGGVLPCLPFFVLAPGGFVHDVVTAQLGRRASFAAAGPTPLGDRLGLLTGLGGWNGITTSAAPSILVLLVLGVLVAVAYGLGRAERSLLDWYVLVSAVVVNLGMFVSSDFYDHYAYFPAAFIALLAGVAVAGTLAHVRGRAPGIDDDLWRSALAGAALTAAAVAVLIAVHDAGYARRYLGEVSDPAAPIRAVVPAGACVLDDYPVDLLLAGRYVAGRGGCPDVVDPFGLFLTDDGGNQPHPNPPFRPAFVSQWKTWLTAADYVILRIPYSDFLPWTPDQAQWFAGRFQLVSHDRVVYAHPFIDTAKDMYIYRNVARVRVGGATASDADLQNGLSAQSAGNIAQAQADYQRALAEDPSNTLAAYDLGVIAQQQGDVSGAERWYRMALTIDPTYVPALNNLSIVLTPGSPDAAIAVYRTLEKLRPGDAQVHLRLGRLLEQQGQHAAGAAEIATAHRLDPTIPAP